MRAFVKSYFFSVQIKSLLHMKKRDEQAITAVSTEILEMVLKNINSRTSHIIRENVGHVDRNHILIKAFEYLYYNSHWTPQKVNGTFLQIIFKQLKDFLHAL